MPKVNKFPKTKFVIGNRHGPNAWLTEVEIERETPKYWMLRDKKQDDRYGHNHLYNKRLQKHSMVNFANERDAHVTLVVDLKTKN